MLNRNGVSLLEVLISVFVLLIGLLAVAALIPVGGVRISQATIADRSGMCGRAGLHEIKIRGWLKPAEWLTVDNTGSLDLSKQPRQQANAVFYRESFAIDPLFLSSNNNWQINGARRFPFNSSEDQLPPPASATTLARVTLDVNPSGGFLVMPQVLADRIFTWRDDLSFPVPDDPEDRPRQMMRWDNGEGAVFPFRPADRASVNSTNAPLAAQVEGNYSWMATVTPMPAGFDFDWYEGYPNPPPLGAILTPASHVDRISRYEVSIVVFYKRDYDWPSDPDLPVPEERSVFAVLEGGGWGGGDAVLVVTAPAAVAQAGEWLDVTENDWLMLRGVELRSRPLQKLICKWYRVVAVDDQLIDGDASTNDNIPVDAVGRYVTLAGPDWQVDTSGNDRFDPPADVAVASLIDNVVGVYTTTVEVDGN